MIKNIIFDVGGVLAKPKTGNWFITPNFWNIVDKTKIDEEVLKNNLKKCLYLHTQDPKSEVEEYEMFKKYYLEVLRLCGYEEKSEKVASELAMDCVYNDDKFNFYEDVLKSLEELSKSYDLYILSDSWPSSFRVLKNNGIDKMFKGIAISSMYSTSKKKNLFDKFLKEYRDVLPDESIYIDDRTYILDKAKEYGFDLLLMNREKENIKTDYMMVSNLQELIDILK